MQLSGQNGGQVGLMDAPAKLGLGALQIAQGCVQRCRQFVQVVGAAIGQGIVHLVPDRFIGVEFRSIHGEALQMNARELATELADGFAFVRLAVVPDDDDPAAQVTEQMTEELAHLGLLDVLAVKLAIQSEPSAGRTDRHRGDGRNSVMLVAVSNDRGLPARSPRTADRRDQEIPGFVNKGDMGTQPRCVFFMRGQSLCFHASIAASSRCVARFSGFW
jgi:hypothetical protein